MSFQSSRRILAAIIGLSSAVAFSQAPTEGAAPPNAGAQGGVAPDAPPEKPGLDVSLLPFTADSIKQVVGLQQEKIQSCYEDHLADKSKAVSGKLMTSFVITSEGLVRKAQVLKKGTSTSLRDPRLHECVKAVLISMTFPKPSDKREHPIEYPFNLKAIK
jgi:hypothetical protein